MTQKEFSVETLKKAADIILNNEKGFKVLQSEHPEMSVEELAQMLLIEIFGMAQIEAEDIVNDLKKGLGEFDAQLAENKANDKVCVVDKLAVAAQEMSDEERKEYYVDILTALQLISKQEISQTEVEEAKVTNAQMNDSELLAQIEQLMNKDFIPDNLAEKVKNGLDVQALAALSKEMMMHKEDYRLMAALQLYIAQKKGEITLSATEHPLPATLLGTLAGAGIDAILATNELAEGKINLKTWQKVMKWIIGAVMSVTFFVMAILAVTNLALLTLASILTLFGTGTFSIIIALILSVCVAAQASDIMVDLCFKFISWLLNFYDEHIATVTDKVLSWINSLKALVGHTREKLSDADDTEKVTPATDTQKGQVQDTDDTVVLQPVLA